MVNVRTQVWRREKTGVKTSSHQLVREASLIALRDSPGDQRSILGAKRVVISMMASAVQGQVNQRLMISGCHRIPVSSMDGSYGWKI